MTTTRQQTTEEKKKTEQQTTEEKKKENIKYIDVPDDFENGIINNRKRKWYKRK
jgi:hypothetical protein